MKARDRQLAEAGNAAAKASAREQQLGQQLSKTEKLLKGSQVGASGHVPHDLHTLFAILQAMLAQSYLLNCNAILAFISLVWMPSGVLTLSSPEPEMGESASSALLLCMS